MTVGLFFRKNSESVIRIAKDTANWLVSHNITVKIPDEIKNKLDQKPSPDFPKGCDMVISLGGDGTLLRAVRISSKLDIPVLGINLGRLGYLTEVEENELHDSLFRIIRGEYKIETREMLKGVVLRSGREIKEIHALNDVYLYRDLQSPLVDAILYIDSERVGETRSDGLIICTATGSTAYALSAGGAIIDHECSNFEIVAICPHRLNQRPIIIPSSKKISLDFNSPEGNFSLFADGDMIESIVPHDMVVITKSEYTAKLIRLKSKNFYQVLKSKFDWSK